MFLNKEFNSKLSLRFSLGKNKRLVISEQDFNIMRGIILPSFQYSGRAIYACTGWALNETRFRKSKREKRTGVLIFKL